MTNLIFNFNNGDGSIATGLLFLSPSSAPFAYSGSLVIGDTLRIPVVTTTTSINNVIPTTYNVRVSTDKIQTEFKILVPELNGGTVDASTLII